MTGYYEYFEVHGYYPYNRTNGMEIYSPITMNQDWPKLTRLIICALLFTFSAQMNTFFVASFFIEDSLKRIGYVYLACAGASDLLVTIGIFPTTLVVLLSDDWDVVEVCNALHFLAQWSCYGYSLSFMMIGIECFLRTCSSSRPYEIFIKMRMDVIAFIYMGFSGVLAGVGVFENLDFDYCNRSHEGNLLFRYWTMLVCHIIPCTIAFITLSISIYRIQKRYNTDSAYKRSEQYVRDSVTTNINLLMFIFYTLFWLPYVIIVYFRPYVSDTRFYISACFGLSRSIIASPIYGFVASNFRRSYSYLMNYCCCRTPIPRYHYRVRNNREYTGPGEVRVHMLQPPLPSKRLAEIHETHGL